MSFASIIVNRNLRFWKEVYKSANKEMMYMHGYNKMWLDMADEAIYNASVYSLYVRCAFTDDENSAARRGFAIKALQYDTLNAASEHQDFVKYIADRCIYYDLDYKWTNDPAIKNLIRGWAGDGNYGLMGVFDKNDERLEKYRAEINSKAKISDQTDGSVYGHAAEAMDKGIAAMNKFYKTAKKLWDPQDTAIDNSITTGLGAAMMYVVDDIVMRDDPMYDVIATILKHRVWGISGYTLLVDKMMDCCGVDASVIEHNAEHFNPEDGDEVYKEDIRILTEYVEKRVKEFEGRVRK